MKHFLLLSAMFWYGLNTFCGFARSANFMLTDKELSSCMINSIHQDRDGIIWISTENGLNRYDGTKVTVFLHRENDSTSISHNYVRYVFEDRAGNYYVGNYLGVQRYRPDTDDFSPMATYSDGTLMPSSPSFITETTDGQVIVSGNMVSAVNLREDGGLALDSLPWAMSGRMPGEVTWGRDGNLWFFINNDAIYCVHRNGVLERRRDLLPEKNVFNLVRDAEGNIYIQTVEKDLYSYDFETGDCRLLNHVRISSATIKCVFRLDSSHLLLGTDGNGVKLLDESTGDVSDWEIDLPALSSRYLKVHQIIRDRDGDLWLALFLKGVARIPMRQSSFQYMGPLSSSSNLVGSSSVSALMAARDGKIWVGTDGEGAYCVDPQKNTSHYLVSRTDGGEVPAILNTLFEDSEGTIWVGSYDEGCGRIDQRTLKYATCRNLFTRRGIFALRILGFAEDNERRVWVASLGSGLFCYDLTSKRVIEELSFEDVINRWQTCLLVTHDNLLLVGTYDGVSMLDLKERNPKPVRLFDKSIIYSLYEDADHQFWAGSSTGLIQFDRDGNIVQRLTSADGLSGTAAYSVMGDRDGILWIGTDQGLSRFDIARRRFATFSDVDGIQGKSFSKNAVCKDRQGRIWMGGSNGISYFQPALVNRQQYELRARVSGFYLHNKPVHANTLSGDKPVVESRVSRARRFHLSHEDNSFSIELSTQQFVDAHLVRYQYTLDDENWQTLPMGSHLVNFSNLREGTHLFRYKAVADQFESPEEMLEVVIRPAWWNMPLAKVCWFLLGLLFLLTAGWEIYHAESTRRRELLLEHQEKENAEKVAFITKLMHEIRTPMSLMISPLRKLLATDSDPERQRMYQMMQRNAERLMDQADHMLGLDKEKTDDALQEDEKSLLNQMPQELPLTSEEASELPVTIQKEEAVGIRLEPYGGHAKYRLLIVDDDYEICDYLRYELEKDFRVETCSNGKEALERIFRHAPDGIISDVMMPEIDGFELCAKVKGNANLCQIPFVLLTAKADAASTLKGLGIGADAYVPKPFYIEILRTTILNLMRNRTLLRNSVAGEHMQEERLKTPKVQGFNDKLMTRILNAINTHLSDPDFAVEQLCAEVGISRVHLYRKLKEITNQTPGEFVRNCRLNKAKELLLQSDITVQEVAEAVGFSKAANFSVSFKELFGYPPLKWKKLNMEGTTVAQIPSSEDADEQ